ncbi:poly(A)-specific ribonuclease complex subunit Pan3 [Schizosaccharomyces cryophilus OY26]|uniref:Poly(A)-specific ribonuclease complex subunit Pan3 n=1 Tax=Schizosaccharomyces cryophilus (strain OY26 / ATCC MYA-4695 / CBS 11777 / NBRC 106824 / NRRL Y48691) TaxID=653667 RepID=S9VYL8_SCHCR|nr:poly(A)-specific ribonuclease complex subunit Pan3 [Schizosaccharomyces cryophilus OY26]EPY52763.1 poly(A)-specific ribonuclease complex subunit Pan3 [Schizosaccharomyces cryophilus OY26]
MEEKHSSIFSTNIPCRNEMIHGRCPYVDKGCIFQHKSQNNFPSGDWKSLNKPEQAPLSSVASSSRLSVNSPSFTPSLVIKPTDVPSISSSQREFTPLTKAKSYSSALSSGKNGVATNRMNSPPKTISLTPSSSRAAVGSPEKSFLARNAAPFSPKATSLSLKNRSAMSSYSSVNAPSFSSAKGAVPAISSPSPGLVSFSSSVQPRNYLSSSISGSEPVQGVEMDRHIVARFPPFLHTMDDSQKKKLQTFLADDLQGWLLHLSREYFHFSSPSRLPAHIFSYHSLTPRRTITTSLPVLGYSVATYKVIDGDNGKPYLFVQLQKFHLLRDKNITNVVPWTKIHSPHIMDIREAFTTHAFRQPSIVFVYEYSPSCPSLYDLFFSSPVFRKKAASFYFSKPLLNTQKVLWIIASQLVSALHTIHSAGMAAKMITAKNVLMVGKLRVALFGLGIYDVILDYSNNSLGELQLEDCRNLGLLLLSLACGIENISIATARDHIANLDFRGDFQSSFVELIKSLILDDGIRIDHVLPSVIPYIIENYENSSLMQDVYHSRLAEQVENDRLLRILLKFEFLDDRPEFLEDPDWSPCGRFWIIRLFRKYMFRIKQYTKGDEHPIRSQLLDTSKLTERNIDLSHLVQCLNKLDAGTEERILLEDSCNRIIVSYKDVKTAINTAFMELEYRVSNNVSIKK